MRNRLLAQGHQRAEHRIAVIGAASAVELVAFEARNPRAISFGPTRHFGLFVQMAIKQHGIRPLAGDVDHDDRCPAWQPDDRECCAWKRGKLRSRPTLDQRHRLVHVAVYRPVRMEGRRLVGYPDVFDQCRSYVIAPALIDESPGTGLHPSFHSSRPQGPPPLGRPRFQLALPRVIGSASNLHKGQDCG